MNGFDLKDYQPGESLYLWWLALQRQRRTFSA